MNLISLRDEITEARNIDILKTRVEDFVKIYVIDALTITEEKLFSE